ncbi:MAG: FkbM family methyltransferase [Gammaproteobacteria bacterium]|nr:FkbM family methyltransferase [Gammaproteobacteria bacterium]MDH3767343.1 FkbM family methyltransferase [Gammaproteobacteria bacterium]
MGKNDPVILEIGCNDGEDTLGFLQVFDNPKIYCFEPDPRAYRRFKQQLGHRLNVRIFNIALSDRNGEITFYQSGGNIGDFVQERPEGWDLSGSIYKPKNHSKMLPGISFPAEIQVPTKTLDTWCEEQSINSIDFIWMDVQGAERSVLSGGAVTLRKTRYLYTEYSNHELYEGQASLQEILDHLSTFTLVTRYPGDILLKNEHVATQ